jgi:hypothetical protein
MVRSQVEDDAVAYDLNLRAMVDLGRRGKEAKPGEVVECREVEWWVVLRKTRRVVES